MKAPATAKEFTSIPIKDKMLSPTNKNATIIGAAVIEVFPDCMWPTFLRKPIIIGILLKVSITAKSIIVAVTISLKLKFILYNFKNTSKFTFRRKYLDYGNVY